MFHGPLEFASDPPLDAKSNKHVNAMASGRSSSVLTFTWSMALGSCVKRTLPMLWCMYLGCSWALGFEPGIRAGAHGFQVLNLVHLRSICAMSTVRSMEVGTHHFTRGPKFLNPKYDMDVYMVALFGGEAQDVLRVGLSKIMNPTCHTNPKIFWHKIIKI